MILPFSCSCSFVFGFQIAYSLIEEQEGRTRSPDDYISFVGLLADPRYCGIIYVVVSLWIYLFFWSMSFMFFAKILLYKNLLCLLEASYWSFCKILSFELWPSSLFGGDIVSRCIAMSLFGCRIAKSLDDF